MRALRIELTGKVELLDFEPSNGLSAKSFAIALHIELPVDFLELRIELELLLPVWKIPVDILLLSLFSTKASKPAEPMVTLLSLLGFHVLDSVAGSSEVSGTMSSSSESRRMSVTFPKREERDFTLFVRVITASILSLLSSSLGVGIEEELDAVIVGDRAGRLCLLARDCTLSRLRDLPRVTRSSVCLASLTVTIGGGRLLSREVGDGGRSGKLMDEDKGESGIGIVSGSTTS